MESRTPVRPGTPRRHEQPPALPWDLTHWIEGDALLRRIRKEVDLLNWSRPELVRWLRAKPQYRPRELMVLLTYAYATGVFDSDTIVKQCGPTIARQSEGRFEPDQRELRSFRRENPGLLKWCLTRVLKGVLRDQLQLGERLLPAGCRRLLEQNAVLRLNAARHMDQGGS